MEEEFWLYDPTNIFKSLSLIPRKNMSHVEKLNCMSRVLILATLIMFFFKFKYWWVVLLIGLFTIVLIGVSSECQEYIYIEESDTSS
jgi:hypothetical protein